jgi:branched-chain amino acid transport system permease protein
MMVIMGGMGTIFGPALGAFVFELLHYFYEGMTEHWLLLMGFTVIALVLFLPKGIGGLLLSLTSRNGDPVEEPEEEAGETPRERIQ